MKKILLILVFMSSIGNADTTTLSDIKILIEQNGKKIEQNGQKIEQNTKKIDMVDARINNVEKRLDFMQNIIYIILAAVFGVPIYLDNRRNKRYITCS